MSPLTLVLTHAVVATEVSSDPVAGVADLVTELKVLAPEIV